MLKKSLLIDTERRLIMPDVDEMKEGKKYYTDVPQQAEGFFLKGSNALDWGMKNRLARIFNPKTG